MRLEETLRLLQQKRRYNPQFGREAIYEAARAEAAGASERLYRGRRLDIREQAQTQQAEQFKETLAMRESQFEQRAEMQRGQFAESLTEQKRSAMAREQERTQTRESQMSAASKALIQSYVNMGVQLPMSYLLMKQYLT